MDLYNRNFAFDRRHLGFTVCPVFLLALAAACSGRDATDIESSEALATPEAAESVDNAKGGDSDGLTLVANTDELVAGTYTRGERRVNFEISHDAGERVLSIHSADGAPLLHTQLNAAHESAEFGSELRFYGPPGSLFSANGPAWELVTTTGDGSRLFELTSGPEFELVSELGAALARRTDVDAALLDRTLLAGTSGEVGSEAALGAHRQALNPFSEACVTCQLGCSAAYLECVAGKSGWLAWIICAPANAKCHYDCVGSSCQ